MFDLPTLAQQCAPEVHVQTMMAVVSAESRQNPYAIGVVGKPLAKQPQAMEEALGIVRQTEQDGRVFSIGVAQVRASNLKAMGVSYEEGFNPCVNLYIGSQILKNCYLRAIQTISPDKALHAALSCYYSGNFERGFKPDARDGTNYVQRVLREVQPMSAFVPALVQWQGKAEQTDQSMVANEAVQGYAPIPTPLRFSQQTVQAVQAALPRIPGQEAKVKPSHSTGHKPSADLPQGLRDVFATSAISDVFNRNSVDTLEARLVRNFKGRSSHAQ